MRKIDKKESQLNAWKSLLGYAVRSTF